MSRRSRSRALGEIVRVRKAQEKAAEMAVGLANLELRRLGEEREQRLRKLEDDQARWVAAMTGASLDPAMSAVWSAAVLAREADVRSTTADIADAEDVKAERSGDWRAALARSNVARDLAESARRSERRALEESALADLADRFAQPGRRR